MLDFLRTQLSVLRKAFSHTVLLSALLLMFSACDEGLEKDIPIIIDADTANEVDDLFAIVRAMKEPRFDLLGITSAQFHISPLATDTTVLESQRINEEIAAIMGFNELPLPMGANGPISAMDVPAKSEAADFIIEKAHEYSAEQKLEVVILGSCTNVASAILQDPTIIPKIRVSYIGFWHDVAENLYDKKEFNSGNDTLAVEVLLNTAGLDFNVMTATTCQHLVFDKTEVLAQLKDKGEIGDYLMNRWNTYKRWWTDEDPEKNHWIMWDVAIIEALAKPELATKKFFQTPPENTERLIEAYTDIKVAEMKQSYWQALEAGH